MKHLVLGILILALPCALPASGWETFLNSNDISTIWFDGEGVWWGSSGGVVFLDPETSAHSKISKAVDGLKSNKVESVVKDESGRLWIGTQDQGLCVLEPDGDWEYHNTSNLHLLSDHVSDIAGLGARVAVGTSDGMTLFDDGEFSRFFNGNDWASSGCDSVLAVSLNSDQVLVGTECGLFYYTILDGTWERLISGREVYRIDRANDSLFWVVTWDSIYTYDGVSIDLVPKRFIEADIVRDIGAADSTVWVVTNWGPAKYDFAGRKWQRERQGLSEVFKDVQTAHVADDGTVWIGTKRGAAVFGNGAWTMYASQGPAGNYVQDICIDRDGNVWCATGTRGGFIKEAQIGILRFDGFGWEQITKPTLPSNNPYCLCSNPVDGSVWVGFWFGGLVQYDINTQTWTPRNDIVKNTVISDIYIDQEANIFFGEYLVGLGLLCSDGTDIHYSIEDEEACIRTLCVTSIGPGPEGTVLVGSYISPDAGCLAEITRLDIGADCTDKGDDQCEIWTAFDPWVEGNGYSFALDAYGVAWMGTSGGLSSYGSGTWYEVASQIGAVWDIETDMTGTKWIATDQGLIALKGRGVEWDDFTGSIETYNSTNSPLDGSPVKALALDADGAVWIGTGGGGVYRLSPPAPVVRNRRWVEADPYKYNAMEDHRKEGIRFSGFLPGSAVKVYTVSGDLVAELDPEKPWYGHNMAGEELVPGVYIYHAYAEDGSEFTYRLVIIR
jgi:sugar lactone lactonase YvrE